MLPWAVLIIYSLCLFAFASWAEGYRNAGIKRRLRVPAYALALAVYCTSWTFYGAVGSAVSDGWSYLPIYVGPILVFVFAHPFLIKLIDAVKSDGANSISEFIGGRFSKSRGVAALVTILALLGSIPYLALQLRSVGITYSLISGGGSANMAMAIAAFGLTLFAMVYGTRRYEAAGRNDAVLFAVGIESLVKLAALLFSGIIAVILITQADTAITTSGISKLTTNFQSSNIGIDFFVITLLSMAAIVCLPRQFYVTVIEAESSSDLSRARWPFVAYLTVTLLVVFPISAAGMSLLSADIQPDLYVLQLPLSLQIGLPALIVFLGGFSAATAMVLVEIIALSTMVSNDLMVPLLLRSKGLKGQGDLGRAVLTGRRFVMAAMMIAALGWALAIPDNQQLASIGLVAFAAMAQFAPVLILAVTGSNRDAIAAKAGLITGLVVWIYTLVIPQMAGEAWLSTLKGTLFNPVALLGIDGLSPISHGAIWSIGANLVIFSLVTMRRIQPTALPGLFRNTYPSETSVSTIGELETLAARFVGLEIALDAFVNLPRDAPINSMAIRKAERLIAGVIGLPSARAFMRSALYGSNLTHKEVARILDDTGQSLQFSKGLLAATLENIDPGVSVVDRNLNIVAWNSRYLEMFDYPADVVHPGVPVANLIRYNAERGECGPGEVEAHVEKRLVHMRRGLVHSFERIRPDGRVFKTVGGPMPSGGYVMCFTDVTAESRAIDALVKTQAELEMRVDERTFELRNANRALAAADAEKTRFLAAASHDLLQPINAARLFAAALGRDIDPKQHAILSKLDRSIESANTLLRALLDISRLDAGGVTPQPKPMRLRPLLTEMAETFAPLAREQGLSLRVGTGDAIVETDAGLLRSIVQNFLSNAIHHTAQGGIILGVRRQSGMARIDVVDTGPGIPEDKQGLIFREFERLASAREGGNGLGLAIVDRTARLLDARISLRSILGKGSRFSVSLRLASLQHDLPIPVSERRRGSARALHILVVDDDIANCEAMESYLSQVGHHVSIAATAVQALTYRTPFDVALVDFNLGDGKDGLHLGAVLRWLHPGTCIALVTATPAAEYANRAELTGVTVLHKPVSADDLETWINDCYGV